MKEETDFQTVESKLSLIVVCVSRKTSGPDDDSKTVRKPGDGSGTYQRQM